MTGVEKRKPCQPAIALPTNQVELLYCQPFESREMKYLIPISNCQD